MATFDFEITEDGKRRSRLRYLVLEGGKLVLKYRIDKEIGSPPTKWLEEVKEEIEKLLKRKIIHKPQFDILYPSSGDSSSENYDVTLLVALYRNFLSKRPSSDPIWLAENKPDATNFSTEADYVRIRDFRNELIHFAKDGRPTETEFETMWENIAEVLVRVGDGLPNLERQIEDMKTKLIDKECDSLITVQLQQLREQDKMFGTIVKEVRANNPLERSKKEINDTLGEYFVETTDFQKAQKILEKEKLLVLKGAQGEGKTTFSKRLVKDPDSCLKINNPNEWHYCSNERVKTVIIDDMFGRAMFVKDECRKWLKHLPLMIEAIEKGRLNVIITSRPYILKEVFYKMHIPHLIKSNKNTLTISSKNLTNEEKQMILLNHMNLTGKDVDEELAKKCVNQSNHPSSYIVGFPECAKISCERKYIFEKEGEKVEDFFKTPMFHIQKCLENTFESYDYGFKSHRNLNCVI